jgi:hypothetical protein
MVALTGDADPVGGVDPRGGAHQPVTAAHLVSANLALGTAGGNRQLGSVGRGWSDKRERGESCEGLTARARSGEDPRESVEWAVIHGVPRHCGSGVIRAGAS